MGVVVPGEKNVSHPRGNVV